MQRMTLLFQAYSISGLAVVCLPLSSFILRVVSYLSLIISSGFGRVVGPTQSAGSIGYHHGDVSARSEKTAAGHANTDACYLVP